MGLPRGTAFSHHGGSDTRGCPHRARHRPGAAACARPGDGAGLLWRARHRAHRPGGAGPVRGRHAVRGHGQHPHPHPRLRHRDRGDGGRHHRHCRPPAARAGTRGRAHHRRGRPAGRAAARPGGRQPGQLRGALPFCLCPGPDRRGPVRGDARRGRYPGDRRRRDRQGTGRGADSRHRARGLPGGRRRRGRAGDHRRPYRGQSAPAGRRRGVRHRRARARQPGRDQGVAAELRAPPAAAARGRSPRPPDRSPQPLPAAGTGQPRRPAPRTHRGGSRARPEPSLLYRRDQRGPRPPRRPLSAGPEVRHDGLAGSRGGTGGVAQRRAAARGALARRRRCPAAAHPASPDVARAGG